MKNILVVLGLGVFLTAAAVGGGAAVDIKVPEVGVNTRQEEKNLQRVLHWWQAVYEAHHVELAAQYMLPNYIQHNPNVAGGRDGFVDLIGRMPPVPIREGLLYQPPIMTITKENIVTLVFEREDPNPKDPTVTYKHNWMEVIRVEDGMIAEHWDPTHMRDPATYNPPYTSPYDRWLRQQPPVPGKP